MSTSKPEKPKILVDHVEGDPANLPEGVVHAPGRSPDAPPRLPRQIEVSDDPQMIAWTRQAYEADLDQRFAAAMGRVKTGEHIFLEFRDALEQRPARAADELRRLMTDEQASVKARAWAAEFLASLGHSDGEVFLLAGLNPTLPDRCTATVTVLDHWSSKNLLSRPEIAARVLDLLRSSTDPAVIKQVVHICRWRNIPGAEEVVCAALLRGQEPREELGDALAHLATSAESVQAALPYLFRQRQKKYTMRLGSSFHRLLDHPDPKISQPLRRALQQYLLTYEGDDRLGQHWAGDLACVADLTDMPILEDIVARAKDPVSRAYALRGLARLEPERAVERVLAEIQRDRPWSMLTDLLQKYAVEADYERICALVYPSTSEKKLRLERNDARLLLEKLGSRGRQQLLDRIDQFEAHAREWIKWKLEGLEVRQAVTELHAAGVIEMTPEEVMARIKEHHEKSGKPLDTTEPSLLTLALGYSDLTVYFDTETGSLPCKHHDLILDFARSSGGRFGPECPVQIWHCQDEDDYKGPYTVQFIYCGRLYRFAAENYGDYYDVDAVVRAMNVALEHNGQRERYIGLYTGDQCAHFVFADPAAFIPIAQRYGLPLSQDGSEAMRAGRAYEQHVFDSLKK
jgi:hypothetical protein